MTIHDQTRTATIPQFIANANGALNDLGLFASSARAGLDLYSRLPTMRGNIREAVRSGLIDKVIDADIEDYVRYGVEQLTTEMPYLYGLAIVRLVTILEVTVTDACIEALVLWPHLRLGSEISDIKGPLVEFAAMTNLEQAECIVAAIIEKTRSKLKRGVGRFEPVLDAIGLGGGVDDGIRKIICEMLEIRNVVVHRRGRADMRLVQNCGWLGVSVGTEVHVTKAMFDRYLVAMKCYVVELFCRWSVLDGASDDVLAPIRQDLAARIAELESGSASGSG
jgi:hypothetical protein